MLDLTFGEQVKIILSRKGMTIKELAEIIEERTGKKMSRQNLTQRLGRDNFQEQDMRMIAEILGCPFQLSILADSESVERASNIEEIAPTQKELLKLARAKERKEQKDKLTKEQKAEQLAPKATESERDMTIGELVDIHKELDELMEPKSLREYKEHAAHAPEESEALPESVPEVIRMADEEVDDSTDNKVRDVAEDSAARIKEEDTFERAQGYMEASELAKEAARAATVSMSSTAEQEEAAPETATESVENGMVDAAVMEDTDVSASEMAEGIDDVMESSEEAVQSVQDNIMEETPEEKQEKSAKKEPRGWRAYFQRRSHKEEKKKEEVTADELSQEDSAVAHATEVVEEPATDDDYIDYEHPKYEADMKASAQVDVPGVVFAEDEPVDDEDLELGDVNPNTGHEYESNSVRMHPKRIGYVQVYDRTDHQWTDMTEWAFLGYQERKKALLGKDYDEPIYLD